MVLRHWLPAIGTLLLAACSSGPSTPDGAVILEEAITLTREAHVDSAMREITVDGSSIVVASVEEDLTDVRLKLSLASPDKNSPAAVEVENNLEGAGLEVAALELPRSARVIVTLTGPQNANTPGRVTLKVQRFDAKGSKFTALLSGLKAWSSATNSSYRVDQIKKAALPNMDRAIAGLEKAPEGGKLAADARLIKANMLQFFTIDMRESRAEAQRAARAFDALTPHALNAARAKYLEAQALSGIALDRASVNPTSDEAAAAARQLLGALIGEQSPFGPIEKARAISAIARIDLNESKLDEAQRRLEQARTLFADAGHLTGELEQRAYLAKVLGQRGRRAEAAEAYESVLPEVARISNPQRRAEALIEGAGNEVFSGRTDEAAEHLLQALTISREYNLPLQEAAALQNLGYLYFYRGDQYQAKALLAEALKITRAQQDAMELVYALQAAGVMARYDGDYVTAIDLHKEGVARSANPIVRMRTMRHLALDYLGIGNYPEAIAQLRASLAVDLQDPAHYAYSDVRRDLAETLLMHGDGSRASVAEAEKLLSRALQQSIKVQDKAGEIGAHRVAALLLTRQGKPAEALAEYERTFALIFEYRAMSANPQFRFATVDHELPAFRGYFDLVMRNVVADRPGRPRPASAAELAAMHMLERARESHLGAARSVQMDAESTARVDALLAQMADKSLTIATLLKRDLNAQETTQLEALQLDMARLRVQLDRERTPATTKPTGERPEVAARAWRAVAPGAVQLSYALGNDHAYVWARGPEGTRVAMLSEKPEAIERELTELAALDAQRSPEKIERALAHMSSVLLPAKLLPADTKSVEVVAEGRIASVPFGGLSSPADPARRLIETHSVTMIASLVAAPELASSKQARPFRLVALASGSGTLRSAPVPDATPKLQTAIMEIREVAGLFEARGDATKVKLLTGAAGNAAALRGMWSSGADVVHFATHALADLRQPLASLLVLPANDAAGKPTYLTAGQVQEWRGDADLVFLSACESAIGPPRFAGGMPGLQSAFLRAGARTVIATLWPIEDVLASEFSADFYRRFTSGETASQSLSNTQRAWLEPRPQDDEGEQIRRRITALAHGLYTQ